MYVSLCACYIRLLAYVYGRIAYRRENVDGWKGQKRRTGYDVFWNPPLNNGIGRL